MGQNLNIGIATTIYAKKNNYYTSNEIQNILAKSLNLEIYTMQEDEKNIYLSLKEEIFMENYEKLIKKEYNLLNLGDKAYKVFDEIKNLSYNELLKAIEEQSIYYQNFQFTNAYGHYSNDISYIVDRNYNLEVSADIIAFYLSDKVFLESYYELFKYLRNKLIASMDTPLKDAVFITIT